MGLDADFEYEPIEKPDIRVVDDRNYSLTWLEGYTINVGNSLNMEEPNNTLNIVTLIISKKGGNAGVQVRFSDGRRRIIIGLNANESKVINFTDLPARFRNQIIITHDSAANEVINYTLVGYWDKPPVYLTE